MIDKQLRGVNIGGWFSQLDAIKEKDPETFPGVDEHMKGFITFEDITYIKDCGFDHIRLPVDYQLFFSETGELSEPDRMDLLESWIKTCIENGLMVILDLHRCPGHNFHEGWKKPQVFFTDPSARAASKRVWSYLARRFSFSKDIAFEVLNEPVAHENSVWDRVKDEMVSHIRSISKDNTIVVGSNRWNSAETFDELTPAKEDNIIYSFHYYNPLLFTHQKANWIIFDEIHETRQYPGEYYIKDDVFRSKQSGDEGIWDRQRMKRSLEKVLNFRDTYGLPVSCNEFGVYHQSPRDSQLRWISDFLSILDEYGIGFSYWTYKNLDFGLVSVGEKLHDHLPRFQNKHKRDDELAHILSGSKV